MLAFDHVVFTVDDLEAAAIDLWDHYGLASVLGGRHVGHGTANRIVPLGPDYVELMAVVDGGEAATSVMGRWAAAHLEGGGGPAALCLRTDDVAAIARRHGLEVVAMSRQRPDGSELAWQLAGLEAAFTDGLPFFIQWQVPEREHPGAAAAPHRAVPSGVAWVELGVDPAAMEAWLGSHHLDIRPVAGPAGLRRVGIEVDGRVVTLD